jgi:hypothetical protein
LQTLQDAYAGDNRPKDYTGSAADYAIERWMEKLDRILNGKINSRASGPRDPVRTMAITLATLNMTGKTAKIRGELATALVDSTKPNGYWWDEARAAIERAKNAPPANVAGMVSKTGETVPESEPTADSVGESAVADAIATE